MSGFHGVIGSSKAQRALGDILGKLDNPKITKVVTRRLFDFKHGCKVIASIDPTEREMAETLLSLWKESNLTKARERQDIPAEVASYWHNCLITEYRNALALIRANAGFRMKRKR